MNYVTNYYKNLSEQLQRKVNSLIYSLTEMRNQNVIPPDVLNPDMQDDGPVIGMPGGPVHEFPPAPFDHYFNQEFIKNLKETFIFQYKQEFRNATASEINAAWKKFLEEFRAAYEAWARGADGALDPWQLHIYILQELARWIQANAQRNAPRLPGGIPIPEA